MDWSTTLAKLKADEANWASVARSIGISAMQVRRIARGETTRPRIDTAQKIADYYERREQVV